MVNWGLGGGETGAVAVSFLAGCFGKPAAGLTLIEGLLIGTRLGGRREGLSSGGSMVVLRWCWVAGAETGAASESSLARGFGKPAAGLMLIGRGLTVGTILGGRRAGVSSLR